MIVTQYLLTIYSYGSCKFKTSIICTDASVLLTTFYMREIMATDPPVDRPKTQGVPSLESADLELDINFELIERRRTVRLIPCPEATEHNDEESWSTWNELMAKPVQQDAKEAMTTLRRLLRRKTPPGDAS